MKAVNSDERIPSTSPGLVQNCPHPCTTDDAKELTRQLQPKGFMIAPGHIFSPEQSRTNPWTRLNVAYLNDPLLKAVFKG